VPVPNEPMVPNAEVYVSSRDVGRTPMDEAKLVVSIGELSVADCLIAHVSTRLFAHTRPEESQRLQVELVLQLLGAQSRQILARLADGVPTTVFHEQQLVHLARLAILHGDRRAADDFAGGALLGMWGDYLLGVNDLLDVGLDTGDDDARLSWEIRQAALNHHEDVVPATALHYEVYRVIWPELKNGRYADVDAAFRDHTGMTIGDYFTVGAAVLAQLTSRGTNRPTALPAITPAEYFSSSVLEESVWQAFFALVARDVDMLRDGLVSERAELGGAPTGH
jgi:hypothetical protein